MKKGQMHARFDRWLDQLRTGFWFMPSMMLLLASALALVLLNVDQRFDPGIKSSIEWAYSGGPEGARSLLSTIAGSMITAASVTFSLASVALSIASQQYGSRVLRNFMRDRITQILLGTFVSTFIYSVLVVRAIRGSDVSGGFVPAISVTVAIALSLISLVLLVFFVHHVSTSIQASHIVLVIAQDLHDATLKLYPSKTGESGDEPPSLDDFHERASMSVALVDSGYLQSIDLDKLLAVATSKGVVIELTIKPGDHFVSGGEVARVWGAAFLPELELKHIIGAFLFGGERTPAQDIRYQFQQLTDVVVRALSPGINDPFTAINGIDELASGVSQLARRPRVAEKRHDETGALRLIVPRPQITEILEDTVGHIAIYAAADRFVMAGLHRVLDAVKPDLRGDRELSALTTLRGELGRRGEANTGML
jgi:uncharacterized membrane protein